MSKWKVRLAGVTMGALGAPTFEFDWDNPPDVLRMGDGSLWIWKTRPAVARGELLYEPADVHDLEWVHPRKEATDVQS